MVVDLECCFNCKHLAELVVVVTWRRGVIEQSSTAAGAVCWWVGRVVLRVESRKVVMLIGSWKSRNHPLANTFANHGEAIESFNCEIRSSQGTTVFNDVLAAERNKWKKMQHPHPCHPVEDAEGVDDLRISLTCTFRRSLPNSFAKQCAKRCCGGGMSIQTTTMEGKMSGSKISSPCFDMVQGHS